ncbi:MAG: D-alanyl-D-alanine carboxypeptidase, partial [Clostridia bacterium]|nr:D-alanyl-D-alanine carboxypeptidase [Clostridia bacterium]
KIVGVFAFNVSTVAETGGALEITAFSAYLTDFNSGRVLYAKNENERHEIASMVKIMTANLAFEAVERGELSLDEDITVSETASSMGGSQMFLDANTAYKATDLIKGIIIASANDASVAIAERLCGSHEAFVALMNERAAQLGMMDTKFCCATGLPDSGEQYSTAHDVNIMTRQLMSHSKYYDYAGIWMEDFTHPSGRVTQLVNTNKLIRAYSGCIGGKTGFTNEAGFCLSAGAERDGVKVAATLIGGSDSKKRFAEVSSMFNYAFANYKSVMLYKGGAPLADRAAVKGGKTDSIAVAPATDISALMATGDAKPDVRFEMSDSLKAPIAKGDEVGRAVITDAAGQERIIPLISLNNVDKSTFWDEIKKILDLM